MIGVYLNAERLWRSRACRGRGGRPRAWAARRQSADSNQRSPGGRPQWRGDESARRAVPAHGRPRDCPAPFTGWTGGTRDSVGCSKERSAIFDAPPINRRHGGRGVLRAAADLRWMADRGRRTACIGRMAPPQETASAGAPRRRCRGHANGIGDANLYWEAVSPCQRPRAGRRIDSCQSLRSGRRIP